MLKDLRPLSVESQCGRLPATIAGAKIADEELLGRWRTAREEATKMLAGVADAQSTCDRALAGVFVGGVR